MDSNDNKKEPRKVIDISERIEARLASKGPIDKLKSMKIRLDLEHAKIAIPASLLSIVIIVTLANSKLLTTPEVVQSREMASEGMTVLEPSRGIASVPAGTSQSEDELVQSMSQKSLGEAAAIGRAPSALEKLSLETLEGKYAIRMTSAQKISEIEIDPKRASEPTKFDAKIFESTRAWLPVVFEKSIRVQNVEIDKGIRQTYHLVNNLSMPVARVDVRLDESGHLLNLKVVPTSAESH